MNYPWLKLLLVRGFYFLFISQNTSRFFSILKGINKNQQTLVMVDLKQVIIR